MEIKLSPIQSMSHPLQWLIDGLGVFMPAKLREIGWRKKALLVDAEDDDQNRCMIVERSWFGEQRLNPGALDPAIAAEISLPVETIFLTQLSLPQIAAKSLKNTIELRLSEISPIPWEDTAFAVGASTPSEDGRLEVEVALARKKSLRDIQENYHAHPAITIGAAPDDKGKFRFEFLRTAPKDHRKNKPWLHAALLVGSLLLLSFAVDANLARRIESLDAYETSLRDQLAATRPLVELLNGVDEQTMIAADSLPGANAFIVFQDALAALPNNANVLRMSAEPSRMEITGLIPSQTHAATDMGTLTQTSSNRPGFDQFVYRLAPEKKP